MLFTFLQTTTGFSQLGTNGSVFGVWFWWWRLVDLGLGVVASRQLNIVDTAKVIFYHAEGHHARFTLQIPNYGPKLISPNLLTCGSQLKVRANL